MFGVFLQIPIRGFQKVMKNAYYEKLHGFQFFWHQVKVPFNSIIHKPSEYPFTVPGFDFGYLALLGVQ